MSLPLSLSLSLSLAVGLLAGNVSADDGVYGRLDGDLTLSLEAGVAEAVGDDALAGESLVARLSAFYLHTAGIYSQYQDALGVEAQPITRAFSAGVELRPLFLGRWSQALESGPAHLDLLLDSIGIGMGVYGAWPRRRHCLGGPGDGSDARFDDGVCPDFGMEASLGMELSLLPRASTPFIALRGALRWTLRDEVPRERSPSGLLTLTIGYHHLFETHIVDAGDRMPP